MKTAESIKIGEVIPIITERENQIIEYWKNHGRINLSLLDRIRIIKSKK